MKEKVLLFDFDGVISNSSNIAIEEINNLSDKFLTPRIFDKEGLTNFYDRKLRDSLKKFGLDEKMTKDFYKKHSLAMEKRANEISTYPGIIELLKNSNARKFLVTSSYLTAVNKILSKNNLSHEELFEYSLGKETKLSKVEKIKFLLKKFNLNVENCIYIGDTVSDIIYSQEVPMKICAVTYGYNTKKHLLTYSPDYIIDSVEELGGVL